MIQVNASHTHHRCILLTQHRRREWHQGLVPYVNHVVNGFGGRVMQKYEVSDINGHSKYYWDWSLLIYGQRDRLLFYFIKW